MRGLRTAAAGPGMGRTVSLAGLRSVLGVADAGAITGVMTISAAGRLEADGCVTYGPLRDRLGVAVETFEPGMILVRSGAPRVRTCAYCGTTRAADVARCESCGATGTE